MRGYSALGNDANRHVPHIKHYFHRRQQELDTLGCGIAHFELIYPTVAEIIKEDLWPNPLKYFNNEADEEDYEDGEDEDDDGEDEDAGKSTDGLEEDEDGQDDDDDDE
eukprot:Gb_17406 [translate_table: standard]